MASRTLSARGSDMADDPNAAAKPGIFDDPAAFGLAPAAAPGGAPASTGAAVSAPTTDSSDFSNPSKFGLTAAQQSPPAATPPGTTWRGVARNAAAGVTDAAGNLINVLSDPVANLIERPLLTAGAFGYDAIDRLFGGTGIPPDLRNALLTDNDAPQPGTRLISGIGNAVGVDPAAVPATPVEREVRTGTGGALTAAGLGPWGATAPVMGATGAVAGDVAGQAVPDWAKPAAELAGNIVGAKVGSAAASIPVKAVNAATGVTTPTVDAYTRLNIDPTLLGDVTGNPAAKTLQAYTSQAPGASGRVLPVEQTAVNQFGSAVEDTAGRLGQSTTAQAAGDALQTDARNWKDTVFPQQQAAAWAPVDQKMAGAVVDPSNYRTALTSLTGKLAALPETQKALLPPRIQTMLDAINTDVPPGSTMPWAQAQQLRSAIGSIMGIPEIAQSVGKDQLNAAYGGIAQDMADSANANGAGAEFAAANKVSTDGHAFMDNTLSKIIRSNNPAQESITPEQAAKTVLGSGDTTLQAIRQNLPTGANELGAYKLRDMLQATPGQAGVSGTEPSVGSFLTDLNRFRQSAPNGSAALFSDPAVAQRLADLSTVADTMKDTAKRLNVSRTGPFTSIAQSLSSGGTMYALTGSPAKTVAALTVPFIANNLLSRGVTSPALTKFAAAPGPRVTMNPLVAGVMANLQNENQPPPRNQMMPQ